MYKWKRNWALRVLAYNIYDSYHVVQWFLQTSSPCHILRRRRKSTAMSNLTKNRKKRSTNMSRVLLKELQATIAFACFDSPSLIQRGASLSEAAIEDVILFL